MLAPIYEQNAKGRYVHLPERMAMVKLKSFETLEHDITQVMDKGDHYVSVGLDEIPVFIRANQLVVLTQPENRVSKLNYGELTVLGYVRDQATYDLYDDDGSSFDFQKGKTRITKIKVTKDQSHSYQLSLDTNDHRIKSVTFYLIDDAGQLHVMKQELGSIESALTC